MNSAFEAVTSICIVTCLSCAVAFDRYAGG